MKHEETLLQLCKDLVNKGKLFEGNVRELSEHINELTNTSLKPALCIRSKALGQGDDSSIALFFIRFRVRSS